MILNASVTRSLVAPPPTSRKLAGSLPYSLMMSIVAIAKTGAVDHAADLTVELDVVELVLGCFEFGRVFFDLVAHFFDIWMAIQRVVVEVHLGIKRNHSPAPVTTSGLISTIEQSRSVNALYSASDNFDAD